LLSKIWGLILLSAFDTLQSAVAQDADIVIIDTAGRLHNKINLMNELTKVKRDAKKVVIEAPHEVLLVLDQLVKTLLSKLDSLLRHRGNSRGNKIRWYCQRRCCYWNFRSV
jgi:nucleoside-triphosphatase THEP1